MPLALWLPLAICTGVAAPLLGERKASAFKDMMAWGFACCNVEVLQNVDHLGHGDLYQGMLLGQRVRFGVEIACAFTRRSLVVQESCTKHPHPSAE